MSEEVVRGPALRAEASTHLVEALRDRYGIAARERPVDLGGSSNLNLLVADESMRYVVRVYRPWVTSARLADMQLVRRKLARGEVPCPVPTPTRDAQDAITVDGRLVEVEDYVEHDEVMDSWERLHVGLPLLGRIHTLLRPLRLSADGRRAPAANHVEAVDALTWTTRGTKHIRQWDRVSPAELRLADISDKLAEILSDKEQRISAELPRQIVHGDFWDNNVLFRERRVVLVTDLDFLGERPRIDDLALTLYYTNSKFSEDPVSSGRIRRLRGLVDAYDSGLNEHLTKTERTALPLALARTPLAFVGMIASLDTVERARGLAAEIVPDVEWAFAITQDLEHWQDEFTT